MILTGEVIRTIRVKKEYDQIVKEDTKKEGISVNSFFNKLLEKYTMTYRFVNSFPCLIIPCDILREFLGYIPPEKIIEIAEKMGQYIPKHSIFLRGKNPNLKNVLEFIEKCISQHSNWHKFNIQINNGKSKLLLRHTFGKNWSIFIEKYYKSMFKQLFNYTIKTELGPDSLVIIIPETHQK